jgi:hypothetical protein
MRNVIVPFARTTTGTPSTRDPPGLPFYSLIFLHRSKPRPFSTDPSSEMGAILHAVHTVTAGWAPEVKNIVSELIAKVRESICCVCVSLFCIQVAPVG